MLTVGSTDYLLHEGDSLRFLGARPHRFANPTSLVTRVVWVNARQRDGAS